LGQQVHPEVKVNKSTQNSQPQPTSRNWN